MPVYPAWASLIFYDGFDYTAGDAASGPYLAPNNDTSGTPNPGQHNVAYNVDWRYAGPTTGARNAPFISSGSLTVAGMPASVGNSVGLDQTQLGSSRIQVTPAAINTGTVYWSGYLKVDALATTNIPGMLVGGFNNIAGPGALPGSVGACLRVKTDPADSGKFLIGTAMNSGTGAGNVQLETAGHAFGETVFVVAAYTFVAGSNNDMAQMWINPTPGGAQPAPTLVSNPSLADGVTSVVTFNLRNVNTVGTGTIYFDELRIGDDWASVTPEPASALLLAVSGGLVLGSRRRRG
jgi:hypothetical protein